VAKKKATKKKATKKKATKKKAAAAAPATEVLVVGSKVKAAIKALDKNSSGDVIEDLNKLVHWYIQQAAARAEANGRKTVRGHDFLVG
jgi:histone H3/H4